MGGCEATSFAIGGSARQRWLAAGASVAVLLAAVGLALLGTGGDGPGGTLPAPPVGTGVPTPPQGQHKPPLQGLVLQEARPLTDQDAGRYSARVVTTTWAALQPDAGGELTRDNEIDRALRSTTAFNKRHPDDPVSLKLRVLAGIYAPEWAKRLGGFEPVAVVHLQTDRPGELGPFWSAAYMEAYAELQRRLAERYDDEPLVRDNAISGCMTVFAEPFQRDLTGFADLYAQGYSMAADEACLRAQVDAHSAWRHTHQSLALNPFRPWTIEGGSLTRAQPDVQVTLSVAAYCRARLGELCTLSNNSIRSDYTGVLLHGDAETPFLSVYAALYDGMRELGPPSSFQTAAPSRVGDLSTTVELAVRFGANAVEVPIAYDPDRMAADDAALVANPVAQGPGR